jgi:Rieske Fe-S protein
MTDSPATDSNGLTRRQALTAAAALCGFGAVALSSGAVAQASGTLRVQLSQFPALKRVGGAAVVGSLNGVQVGVVRTGRSKYVALDLRCPHAGVTVTPRQGGFICLPPGHGSQFDLDGDKVSGLTPSGLRRLKSRLSGGFLTISG